MPPRRLETWRVKSPWRLSTLMTSAPWSARSMVAEGPETTLVRSIMRMPCNGPGMGLPVSLNLSPEGKEVTEGNLHWFPSVRGAARPEPLGERRPFCRPFVPDAPVLDRGLTQQPALRRHDVAIAVFQLEAAFSQSEHGHVGIGARLG